MSYDIDTRVRPCDHYQQKERQTLSTDDFRTLFNVVQPDIGLRAPVSSLNAVKVYVSGVSIPSGHENYGWELVEGFSVNGEKRHRVRFRKQVRLTNLTFEVAYFTTQAYCLKCNGYGRVSDTAISAAGSLIHVTDHNKLTQRSLKFLLTSTCVFYPQFTSRLKEFIGRKFGLSLTEEDISYECMTALENMKNIQIAQKNVQSLSPQEILRSVDSVISKRDTDDPTLVRTKIQLSSYGPNQVNPLQLAIRTKT